MLEIVKDACSVKLNQATIVIEGPTVDDVSSVNARHLALQEASSLGLPVRGISGCSGPYAVDSQGKSAKSNATLTPEEYLKLANRGVSKFRNEFHLNTTAV